MKKLIFVLWLQLALITQVNASETQEQQLSWASIRDSVSTILKNHNVPGVGVALVHKDSIIWTGGFGFADIDKKKPVTGKTVFRVGSITKTFVALGLLKLVERGELNLDDELRRIAPEIQFENPWSASDPIRLVHLLEHTAGFDDMHFNEIISPQGKALTAQEALAVNPSSRVVRWRPGTRTSYSNPGYGIAGYILEKYSGERFEDFLKALILNPLGMTEASFERSGVNDSLMSEGYNVVDGAAQKVTHHNILLRWAGSLYASPTDLAKFTRLMLNSGMQDSTQMFLPSTIARMEYPVSNLAAKSGLKLGYGLANYSSVEGKFRHCGHSGGITGFISRFRYIPEANVGYVVLLNAVHSKAYNEISDLLVEFLTQDIAKKEMEAAFQEQNLSSFEGYYANKNPRNQIFAGINSLFSGIQVFATNDTLFSKAFMQDPKPMIPVKPGQFRYEDFSGAHIIFSKSADGKDTFIDADGIEVYYEKQSKPVHQLLFFSFLCSLGITVLLLPVAFVWWMLFWFKKIDRTSLYKDHLLMALGILSFIGAIMAVSGIGLEQIVELGSISFRSVVFFVGTIGYAVLMIVGMFISIKYYKQRRGFWKYYSLILLLANLELILLFYQWNLIGLRMWAW